MNRNQRMQSGVLFFLALMLALSQPLSAKPVVIGVQPDADQQVLMESGSQILTSRKASSTVMMRTPEPVEGSRVQIGFLFANNGTSPVNVGPENLTSGQIPVVSYDTLLAEQRKREKLGSLAESLRALGNTMTAASTGGRQVQTYSTNGYVDCGFACNATYRGWGTATVYDPYLAQQAKQQAEAQNRQRFAALRAESVDARSAISLNLRTTTVMPGQTLTAILTFEVPKTVRRAKKATPITLYVRMGSDVHVLSGFAGPIGTLPPPASFAKRSSVAIPGYTGAAVPSNTVVAPTDAYARGVAYYYGQGVSKDYATAASWYQKAADQGLANAQYNLGVMYEGGQGVPQDYATAVSWYRKAAGQGLANAQYNLGVMYEGGQGVSKDYATAASWFRQAAEQGFANAQNNLAVMYEKGQGVPQDFATAINWYRKAAEQGVPLAQNNLGVMYEKGQGVPQDFANAINWYRKAAEQGVPLAQHNLGAIYQNGQGVPQDLTIAANWYRKAAEQGVSLAQHNLGAMYHFGQGVPRDFATAANWYRMAAGQGLANAQYSLGLMYQSGLGVPRDVATAANWYRKAADQGLANAQDNLGVMYQNGHGVPRDFATAANWYRMAADQGLATAQYSLGLMYQNGLGVPRDVATAANWYRKAADQGLGTAKQALGELGSKSPGKVLTVM
ncbi:MAG: tetratricopeptide repeat protein [Porphyrobacter sp.]|nr:tetratricopeptide repeat protein [Porphyrobacter sp.]